MRTCEDCGKDISDKSARAKYCSDACRKNASRSRDQVEDTKAEDKIKTEDRVYSYRTYNMRAEEWSDVRTARTWVDVPLSGEPVKQKDWPDKPDYMNNRQYYLWWDNNFKMDGDTPVITNVHPAVDKFKYEMGGEASRKWGVH